MVECDLVTIIHKNYRQDPTAAPGTFYEVFTFDTFRVQERQARGALGRRGDQSARAGGGWAAGIS